MGFQQFSSNQFAACFASAFDAASTPALRFAKSIPIEAGIDTESWLGQISN